MKITTLICLPILIALGIFAAVYALSGFNLLLFLCWGNVYLFRGLLALSGVAALWVAFWAIAFRPTKTVT